MREIKFMVWIPKTKSFLYVGPDNYYCAEYSGLIFKVCDKEKTEIPIYNLGYRAEEAYPDHGVQQYTGLKDKNGKDIYEGDVVISPIGSFNALKTYEVKYDMGFYLPLNLNSPETEVIGNIYQNPELLERSDNNVL
jgi:uncharacterized phage protein (TIGR01671 family)